VIGTLAALLIIAALLGGCAAKKPKRPAIFPPLPSIDSPAPDCESTQRGCEGRSTHEA
jgi:hypothetical protein